VRYALLLLVVAAGCQKDRGPPADCGAVGAKLASYRVGNYAKPEERERVVGELADQCVKEGLTQAEGACIVEANGRMELVKCPNPMLPELKGDKGGCKTAANAFASMFLEMAGSGSTPEKREQARGKVFDALHASCVEDRWPPEAVKCIGLATGMADLEPCANMFPKELQDAVEKRLDPVMDDVQELLR
jgi:hypothetical protein